MRLSYFTEDFLQIVRARGAQNPAYYHGRDEPWVTDLAESKDGIRESQIEVVELPELVCDPSARTEMDADNAIALYEHFKVLSPVQASDERLWAWLTHTCYWDYMRARWPRDGTDSFASIETRWFFKGSGMERLARNGLGRLWWGAYATKSIGADDPYRLTRVLFQNTEIQFGYMERLFGKNRSVLHAMLDFAERNMARITRRRSLSDWARETGKMVNQMGGVLQLDAMEASDVQEFLENFLRSIYGESGG